VRGKAYAIFAQAAHGPKLWYDGSKFTNNDSPKFFGNSERAFRKAKELLKRFGGRNGVLHRYKVWITSTANVRRDLRVAGRRPNPDGLEGAADRFEDFTGHEAESVIKTHFTPPRRGLVVGQLDLIGYRVKRDGVNDDRMTRYAHTFRKKSRPLLAVSEDGKQLLIVGGRYEFTEAGIEDR
jgi:hypothetical protein